MLEDSYKEQSWYYMPSIEIPFVPDQYFEYFLRDRVVHSKLVEIVEILCSDWLRSKCCRIGGFHAGKGSIIGAGVSSIMIPPIIDYFCTCPPITVSLS